MDPARSPSPPPSTDPTPLEVIHAVTSQGAVLDQHAARLQSVSDALCSLGKEVRRLSARLPDPCFTCPLSPSQSLPHSLSADFAPSAPAGADAPRESPISHPDKFSGVLGTCDGFLVQCALVFKRQPVSFQSDEAKICYVAGLLHDRALAWYTAVSEGQPHVLSSYSSFVEEMRRVFDRPVRGREAPGRLLFLRQGDRSVAEYSVDVFWRPTRAGTMRPSGACSWTALATGLKTCWPLGTRRRVSTPWSR